MARAQAMKLIYEWEMGGHGGEETRLNLLEVSPNEEEADFMNRMFEGVVANVAAIDGALSPYLKGWTLATYQNMPLCWGKCVDGVFKNHLPKGLRVTGR